MTSLVINVCNSCHIFFVFTKQWVPWIMCGTVHVSAGLANVSMLAAAFQLSFRSTAVSTWTTETLGLSLNYECWFDFFDLFTAHLAVAAFLNRRLCMPWSPVVNALYTCDWLLNKHNIKLVLCNYQDIINKPLVVQLLCASSEKKWTICGFLFSSV